MSLLAANIVVLIWKWTGQYLWKTLDRLAKYEICAVLVYVEWSFPRQHQRLWNFVTDWTKLRVRYGTMCTSKPFVIGNVEMEEDNIKF